MKAITHALIFVLLIMVVMEIVGLSTRGVRRRTGGGIEMVIIENDVAGGVEIMFWVVLRLLVGETACKTKNLNNR